MRVADEQKIRPTEPYSVAVVQLMFGDQYAVDERTVRALGIRNAPRSVGRGNRAVRARERWIGEADIVRGVPPYSDPFRRQGENIASERTGNGDKSSLRAGEMGIGR